jgi:hypothetical protein
MPYVSKGALKAKAPKKAVKVSQYTIDKIKGAGMAKSLKTAARLQKADPKMYPGAKEYVEGVKRMYGARRLSAAAGKAADKRIQKPSLRKPKRGGGSSGNLAM